MKIQTSCENCVFATWEGNTQIGCNLDRISKFRKNGAEVMEVYGESGREFFVIDERRCTTCRDEKWAKPLKRRDWKKQALSEVSLKCDLIIHVKKEHVEETAEKCVLSAFNQKLPPKSVVIVMDYELKDMPINNFLLICRKQSIPWRIEQVNNPEIHPIDLAVKASKGNFYAVFNANTEIPLDYLQRINTRLNLELKQIVMILADNDGNGFFIEKMLHEQAYGNNVRPLHEKILEEAENQNKTELIWRLEDL